MEQAVQPRPRTARLCETAWRLPDRRALPPEAAPLGTAHPGLPRMRWTAEGGSCAPQAPAGPEAQHAAHTGRRGSRAPVLRESAGWARDAVRRSAATLEARGERARDDVPPPRWDAAAAVTSGTSAAFAALCGGGSAGVESGKWPRELLPTPPWALAPSPCRSGARRAFGRRWAGRTAP